MRPHPHPSRPEAECRRRPHRLAVWAATFLGFSIAGAAPAVPLAAAAAKSSGPVDVLYAASLEAIMDNQVGPAFDRATGDKFVGFPGASKELANEVKGRLRVADVFVSASPAVDRALMGQANGSWVSHYREFGRTVVELGYSPKSRFAADLRSKPWYEVVTEPGFKLGRTDPATDPKGVLAVKALEAASKAHHIATLATLASESSDVFPETDLVGRVQLGDLDAGFFYSVEAVAAKLPAVPLTGAQLYATYTVAVVNRAPHPAAAAQFVSFLHSREAQTLLRADGMAPVSQA